MKRLLIGLMLLSLLLVGCSKETPDDDVTLPTVSPVTTTTAATAPKAPPVDLVGTWNAEMDYTASLKEMGVEADNATVTVRCSFNDNGIYQFYAESEDFDDVVRQNTDALIKSILDMNNHTQTVEEYLEEQGLTRDTFVPVFIEYAGLADSVSAVYGTFRFDGDKLIMDDEEALYSYDGNALTVTSAGVTVVFTPFIEPTVSITTTTTAISPTTPVTDSSLVGTWQGQYAMDMLGFDTQHTLMQTVTYTFKEDGTFTAKAGVPLDTINAFLDAVLEEHDKTCEEMFGADRETVIEEVLTVTVGDIDNGTYLIDGADVTMVADDFLFIATMRDDVLTVDDGGIAYPCTKIEP